MRSTETIRIAITTMVMALGGAAALLGGGQSAQISNVPPLSFEVAVIKPDNSGVTNVSMSWGDDRFTTRHITLAHLIGIAYGVNPNEQISGAPVWVKSEKFDIDAKLEDSSMKQVEQLPMEQKSELLTRMVRSLLEDRCQLRVSHETKELPVFALVVAKNGPKLTPTTLPPDETADPRKRTPKSMKTVARGQLIARGISIPTLISALAKEVGGRTILDETGLKGEYDFKLDWTPELNNPVTATDASPSSATAPLPDSSGPSIFTALQEQLGLKLESKKAPRDVVVIDHVERPSGN
ncbi:MAG TPA: TIGR03435 family protein [Candidatus Acidoferrales bacterium]|jgi:uncharacterized protein (TIGR03435 family)|nr:TIGR03435 family protein [Candidatus Acidoferrales bacterium]